MAPKVRRVRPNVGGTPGTASPPAAGGGGSAPVLYSRTFGTVPGQPSVPGTTRTSSNRCSRWIIISIVLFSFGLFYVYWDFLSFETRKVFDSSVTVTSIKSYLVGAKQQKQQQQPEGTNDNEGKGESLDIEKQLVVEDLIVAKATSPEAALRGRRREAADDGYRPASEEVVQEETEDTAIKEQSEDAQVLADKATAGQSDLPTDQAAPPIQEIIATEKEPVEVEEEHNADEGLTSVLAEKQDEVVEATRPPLKVVVDENAKEDVVVEGDEGEDDHEEEEEEEEEQETSSKSDLQETHVTKLLPRFKKEDLEEHGLSSQLYVYRVVASNVAIRTKPSPIGALLSSTPNAKSKTGLIKTAASKDELLVGYKLVKQYGLWLKLAPFTYAPITKRESTDGNFLSVMKQIRRISIPSNLRKYWRQKPENCSLVIAVAPRERCEERQQIRQGVLQVMRRTKLMTREYDPEPAALTRAKKSEEDVEEDEEEEEGDRDVDHREDEDVPETGNEEPISEKDDVDNEFDPPSNSSDCRSFKTWRKCNLYPNCGWRKFPDREYCELDIDRIIDETKLPVYMQQNPAYDFPVKPRPGEPRPKYFLYQPSGGWNNQRLLFESALIICKLLNRTCIAPPAAPHSNYFQQYNKIHHSAVVGMPRVLNFEKLRETVSVVAVPKGIAYMDFVQQEVLNPDRGYSIRNIYRDQSKYSNGAMKKWSERDILKYFASEQADILHFVNQTLWVSVEWKGLFYGRKERKLIHLHVTPPDHMKRIALNLANKLGPFSAVHVRRGDKVNQNNFKEIAHTASWYASRIATSVNAKRARSKTRLVYIATDELDRTYFDVFKTEYKLKATFCENLPGYHSTLRTYLSKFPKRMFMDILGMIEQLLCTYAVYFLGSGYSTFSVQILRLRKYRLQLASDTSAVTPQQGLPPFLRDMITTCDPANAPVHSRPC